MECLWFSLAVIIIALLIIAILRSNKILKELEIIIMNQEEFDAQIAAANQALQDIAQSIKVETQQILDFIASLPPNVDTSALDAVVTQLKGVSAAIADVFVPAEPQ